MLERKTFIPFGEKQDISIDYLFGIMEDARTTTINRVFDIRTKELHWQYSKGWNSVSVLLSHIYSVEMYFVIVYIKKRDLTKAEEKDIMPAMEMGVRIPEIICNKPIKYYLERLKKSRKLMFENLSKIKTENFHKVLKGYNPKTGYNLAWALYHQAEDEIHHRGQISMIRKLYKEKSIL